MSEPAPLALARTQDDLRARVAGWRREGLTVGFTPTMGALHQGHLSLVELARARADKVAASVFVNPAQFAAHEDLDAYPRDEARDAALLAEAGCDLLYAPERSSIYPDGFATEVRVCGVAEGLESAARPHFFHGVATVVTKLLNRVRPDIAVFGEKDYQQLLVVRRLVADLDLGVEIIPGPTVREPDGLAMSSRNAYLSADQRRVAGRLNVVLKRAVAALEAGGPPGAEAARARDALLGEGFDAVDYVEVRDAETLAVLPESPLETPARILAAARLGTTRLIDNMAVAPAR